MGAQCAQGMWRCNIPFQNPFATWPISLRFPSLLSLNVSRVRLGLPLPAGCRIPRLGRINIPGLLLFRAPYLYCRKHAHTIHRTKQYARPHRAHFRPHSTRIFCVSCNLGFAVFQELVQFQMIRCGLRRGQAGGERAENLCAQGALLTLRVCPVCCLI